MKKNICLLILLGTAFVRGECQSTSTALSQNFKKLNWLQGTWIRTNSKGSQTGYEQWTKTSPSEYRGKGVTLQGKDTLFVEKLRILERENELYYVADVPENQKPVYFKLTEITDGGFVCENPNHDFPKRINYTVDKGKLKATISGNGDSINFLFEKKQSQ